MINLKNISKTYNKNKENEFIALKNINISIKKGEYVAIVGPSGAGKSTLLHILGFIDDFDDGKYIFDNINIGEEKERYLSKLRLEKIGFVLQDFGLLNDDTVIKNVSLPLYFDKTKMKDIQKKAKRILKKVGIYELRNKKVSQLSGGQKQRVAIARALIKNPVLILADEPTGSLDNKSSNEIISLFDQINKNGTTVILVTHNLKIARNCDRIIEVVDGEILNDY